MVPAACFADSERMLRELGSAEAKVQQGGWRESAVDYRTGVTINLRCQ